MTETPSDLSDAEVLKFLKGHIGPVGEPESFPVEYGAATKMARAIDEFDAIHYDEDVGKSRGYRGVVAPWPFLWLIYFNCSWSRDFEVEMPFGRVTVHGEDSYEFHEPIIVGDTIAQESSVSDARLTHGRTGRLGIITKQRRYTNQFGQLCAVLKTTTVRR